MGFIRKKLSDRKNRLLHILSADGVISVLMLVLGVLFINLGAFALLAKNELFVYHILNVILVLCGISYITRALKEPTHAEAKVMPLSELFAVILIIVNSILSIQGVNSEYDTTGFAVSLVGVYFLLFVAKGIKQAVDRWKKGE